MAYGFHVHSKEYVADVRGFSFVIEKDGDVYKAYKSGKGLTFEDDDASEVIQSAINSIESGIVFLKTGTYTLGSAITLNSNVYLVGEGWKTVISALDWGANPIFKMSGVENVGIENLSIIGNGSGFGIGIEGDNYDILIRRVYFKDLHRALSQGTTGTIYRLVFEGNVGIGFTSLAFLAYRLDGAEISRNYLKDGRSDGFYISGSYIKVSKNILKNFAYDVANRSAIFIHNQYVNSHTICIEGNTIELPNVTTNDRHGIVISGEASSANEVYNIVVKGNPIKGITDSAGNAIYLHAHPDNPDNVHHISVIGNPIDGATRGVCIYGCNNVTIAHNVFRRISVEGIYGLNRTNNVIAFRNLGYVTENSGVATFSGDGSTTEFKIEHGLAKAPSKYVVSPLTPDAHADKTISADDTYIIITFSTAPPSGTDNLKFSWWAEV